MMKNMRTSGFTIIEVIVSTVIFTIVAAGLYASVSSLRKPAGDTTKTMNAALIGKNVLEDLRSRISASDWDSGGPLDPANSPYTLTPVILDGITYTPSYIVNATDPSGARRVDVTVTWDTP